MLEVMCMNTVGTLSFTATVPGYFLNFHAKFLPVLCSDKVATQLSSGMEVTLVSQYEAMNAVLG